MKQFDTPILFIIFNRPETEAKVFEVIRKIKPKELYVTADGPRKGKRDEAKKCKDARKIIDDGVDWKCEVHKLYRSDNLGCKFAPSTAIDWFFKNVKEGIILEDDCLPDITFFRFCSELLDKYRENKNILIISGDNFQDEKMRGGGSYYFSNITNTWGWASWKDRWAKYDVNINDWPKIKKNNVIKFDYCLAKRYWEYIFDKVYAQDIDAWDYQLLYLSMKEKHLNVVPNINLIENIGVDESATHTTNGVNTPKSQSLIFPIKHTQIQKCKRADLYTQVHYFKINILRTFMNIFGSIIK